MSKPHTLAHISPADAAQIAGVSRWTIMRAINSQQLKAMRDNRNHWKIAPDDLEAWRPHSVQAHQSAHPDDSATIREKLAAQTARADAAERARDQAEADRDAWREQAQQLAKKSPLLRIFGR